MLIWALLSLFLGLYECEWVGTSHGGDWSALLRCKPCAGVDIRNSVVDMPAC